MLAVLVGDTCHVNNNDNVTVSRTVPLTPHDHPLSLSPSFQCWLASSGGAATLSVSLCLLLATPLAALVASLEQREALSSLCFCSHRAHKSAWDLVTVWDVLGLPTIAVVRYCYTALDMYDSKTPVAAVL